jgi:Fe-S-cluster containining protein
MQLPVLTTPPPWYVDGLKFTCTQCGNCCSGPPGVVWISATEIRRLAEYLKITVAQATERYCRPIDGRWSLQENRNAQGEHDCIFLRTSNDGRGKRTCSIYPVRPLQCRTWPFWAGNLGNSEVWNRSAQRCPGMNHGRKFTQQEIDALRDAVE